MKITREEQLTDERIAALQEKAWAKTWQHAWARSPFYHEHLRRAGGTARNPIPLREIARVPTIDKSVLAGNSEAFQCVPPERVVDIVTTSSTTGKPLVCPLTEADLQRLALNEFHSFRCAGLSACDTVLLAVTLDRCFIAGMAYFLGLRLLGCAIVRVGPATPMLGLEMLRRARVTAMVGVPSSLLLLAGKAAEAGLDPAKFGVRKLICIGESIRERDFSLNRAGELLEQRWQARVYSTYGNTELAASLCECDAGQGGHLHPESLFLEALDETGRAAPDGRVGELTATTLGVEAMPLIRYRTGDFAAIYREPCRCGRRALRIGPVVGRAGQKLKLKGTTVFPGALKAVLDSFPEISAYVIVARRDASGADAVEVRIARGGDQRRALCVLRERFQGAVKVVPEITLAAAAQIEALQMPEGARKRRYFVDLRQPTASPA
ncbi:MAG: AMP-binding protein [Verrucomicrobiota bacterium]|jgi:phenylacetate-CoA ligase